ncbi:MAG TPA: AAA family ATPase, partial [Burkholderiaceae bacterium]|nr:AAA family ATPase [Burkholderiaceae bacterium]
MGSAAMNSLGLRMRLLGDPEVRSGDGPALPLPPSRRTRALLGYLAATGTPQSRATLCDLLWDGSDDPRAALRWSLTKLRAVVNDDTAQPLQADRDKVSFDAGVCEIDSLRVGALLGAGSLDALPLAALEDAARALQGEFLDGLELPACYRFHHWCMAERERFARLRRNVLDALVSRLVDDPQRALPHGRAMVAADPLAEAAHATLVRLLAAAGRYPEAERHHAWARELLRREIALPDGGPLDEAIRNVRRQQRHAASTSPPGTEPAASPAPSSPSSLSAGPASFLALSRPAAASGAALVGRSEECSVIEAALAGPRDAPVLLLLGEPGIGKTRLLDHLAQRAGALGLRVIRARCFEAEAVRPYGFWLDALRGVPTDGASAQVLEGLAPWRGGPVGAVSREQLFDAVASLLSLLAQRQPLAIVVDDLQWIDDASAALLHYVARRLAEPPMPVVLVAAARAGEVDDNPGAKGLVQSLARERALQRLELRPLGEDDVRGWLGHCLADVGKAVSDSGGNPLYLVELSRAAEVSTSPGARTLEALIDERLRALDEASRDLLGWAAAVGGEFDAESLAA